MICHRRRPPPRHFSPLIRVRGAASGTISSGTTGNIHNAAFTVSSAANGGENSAIPTDGRLSIRTSLTACTAPSNGERHSQPRLSFDSKIVNTAQSGKFLFPSVCLEHVVAGIGTIETTGETIEINACDVNISTSTTITPALFTARSSAMTATTTLRVVSSTFQNIKPKGAPTL